MHVSKQVLKQLIREFSIPLVLSIFWVLYNIYGGNGHKIWDTQQIVNVFGPTFFLLSWLTGQFFRVKKQTKTEKSFSEAEKKMVDLVNKLEEKTEEIIGNLTGGDSFPYIIMGSLNNSTNWSDIFVIHQGKYPLYDVNVRIVDLQKANSSGEIYNSAIRGTTMNIGDMIPAHAVTLQKWKLEHEPKQSYNMFFTARNGGFTQLLRFEKIEGSWVKAIKVLSSNRILFEQIDEKFPRNPDNSIDWN